MTIKLEILGVVVLLSGCSAVHLGPSVPVMPGPGKPFELFVEEDETCQRYADRQVGLSPQDAQVHSTASGALVGAALGAAAGTAIGAISGDVGAGAVIGAGAGLLEGTAIGASNGYGDRWTIQDRYNIAYEQCMYAKGNQIPGVPLSYTAPSIPPPPPAPIARHRKS